MVGSLARCSDALVDGGLARAAAIGAFGSNGHHVAAARAGHGDGFIMERLGGLLKEFLKRGRAKVVNDSL